MQSSSEAETFCPTGEYPGVAFASQPQRRSLCEILLDFGFLTREEVKRLSRDIEVFDPVPFLDSEAIDLLSEEIARELKILPLGKVEKELLLAAERIPSRSHRDKITEQTGLIPRLILTNQPLRPFIDSAYSRKSRSVETHFRLGELLIKKGLITLSALEGCLAEQRLNGGRLGEIILRKELLSEETLYQSLSQQLGYPYRKFSIDELDLKLVRSVPRRFAERLKMLPLGISPDGRRLEVAMADPGDLKVRDILQSALRERGCELSPVLATPSDIQAGLEYIFNGEETERPTRIRVGSHHGAQEQIDDNGPVAEQDLPEIRKQINQVLLRAVRDGASDLHIENLEKRVRVRFRIDGLLQERQTDFNKDNIGQVISVLKIDAGLDITEHRRSQDGVFKRRLGKDRTIDFRINVHSTEFGDDAVIRILDRSANLVSLDRLGFPRDALARYIRIIHNPQGLVLVTGPTGSGKSTTLYSTLDHLNSPEKKIVTAEDPVEYQLDGISQYQVNSAIGNTFAEYGRRFLRKDPDIILIGEIRDDETAEACIKAAMTGHLVFSTLHTNDSLGAVARLSDLGVEAFSIADCLLAVISQRLVRRNCPECAQALVPDHAVLEEFYPDGLSGREKFRKGIGCSDCNGTGYKGRVGLYEFWQLTPEVRHLISSQASMGDVTSRMDIAGVRPLLQDAMEKVESGITTLDEIRRVVPLEQIRRYQSLKKMAGAEPSEIK
ncbi:MAG TPA: ATPase, T2SS/T4P/T4SS family [Acidobacteriota bacterium]|nr:ATPase, T2SS/T4P/T4SS family [Acidobacteriota bacterium]